MVESQPSKLLVAGSIPVSRSSLRSREPSPKARRRPLQNDFECGKVCGRRADLSAIALLRKKSAKADVAQLAERVLGKDEVTSSILVIGSTFGAGAEVGKPGEGCPP